jgi:hypothetical protein
MGEENVRELLEFYLPYFPELIDTGWLGVTDKAGIVHPQAPTDCPAVAGSPSLRLREVSLETVLAHDGVCASCAEGAIGPGGAITNMFVEQLRGLEVLSGVRRQPALARALHEEASAVVAAVWVGRNRTVSDSLFERVRDDFALPRLERWRPNLQDQYRQRAAILARTFSNLPAHSSGPPQVLVALSASDLHFSARHRREHLALAELTATFAVHHSRRNSVWLLHVPSWPARYGAVLEQDVPVLTPELRESMSLLTGFCDDAIRYGNWEPLESWWRTCRLLVTV